MAKDDALKELRRRAPAVAAPLEGGNENYRVISANSAEGRGLNRWIEGFPMQGQRIDCVPLIR